ncbi:putative nitronate monooxygenase [Leucoagaricus sp. SymC.cos]|nr:putative nitronate monooxygenase [Leucoagaricus sp. SymC.cos]
MAYATTPALVASAIKAGGVGFLGAGNESAPNLADMIEQARAGLNPEQQALVGMGFVGWVVDRFNTESDPRLETVLDQKVSGVWLAFGNDLGKYVPQIREHSKSSGHNTKILVNVNTIDELKTAVNEWKVDVVIVQGAEAGGRGSIHSPPTLEFVKQAVPLVHNSTPILAAGGIMNGSQMAALLETGASGIVLGTRVLFTSESMISEEMKQIMMDAGPNSTSRSSAYDIAFPPNVWAAGIEARCINNAIVQEFEDELDPAERRARIQIGDRNHLIIYAGKGVSEVNEIQPTETVIQAVAEEATASLKASGSRLVVE